MLYLLPQPCVGYHFAVGEPCPHPLQELADDLGAEGQSGGQLHDHHDLHHLRGQDQPQSKDAQHPPSAHFQRKLTDACYKLSFSIAR